MNRISMNFEELEDIQRPEQSMSSSYIHETYDSCIDAFIDTKYRDVSYNDNSTPMLAEHIALVKSFLREVDIDPADIRKKHRDVSVSDIQDFIDTYDLNSVLTKLEEGNFWIQESIWYSTDYIMKSFSGWFLSQLLMTSDQQDISLDFTMTNMDPMNLGFELEGKKLRLVGSQKFYKVGDGAKNCEFFADNFGHAAGSYAQSCSFTGEYFGNKTGECAQDCKFTGETFGGGAGHGAKRSDFQGVLFRGAEGVNLQVASAAEDCTFTGEKFEEAVGQHSIKCTFNSKTPFDKISPRQEGSSVYRVDGKSVTYTIHEFPPSMKYTRMDLKCNPDASLPMRMLRGGRNSLVKLANLMWGR